MDHHMARIVPRLIGISRLICRYALLHRRIAYGVHGYLPAFAVCADGELVHALLRIIQNAVVVRIVRVRLLERRVL